MKTLPDLFRMGWPEAEVQDAYVWLLGRLLVAGQHERRIEACREIRLLARKHEAHRLVFLTHFHEFDALDSLRDYGAYWRALRAKERSELGHNVELESHRWRDYTDVLVHYAPVLYFRGDLALGCRLLERALAAGARKRPWAYDHLRHVYCPIREPEGVHGVSLIHFYWRLGRALTDWPLWRKFVDDFPGQFFGQSGVSRVRLRVDPSQIHPLFGWTYQRRQERPFCALSFGQDDLIQTLEQVRRRHARAEAKAGEGWAQRRQRNTDGWLELFPEVADLGIMAR